MSIARRRRLRALARNRAVYGTFQYRTLRNFNLGSLPVIKKFGDDIQQQPSFQKLRCCCSCCQRKPEKKVLKAQYQNGKSLANTNCKISNVKMKPSPSKERAKRRMFPLTNVSDLGAWKFPITYKFYVTFVVWRNPPRHLSHCNGHPDGCCFVFLPCSLTKRALLHYRRTKPPNSSLFSLEMVV